MSGMTDWYWIRESGRCGETELPGQVRSFTKPEDRAVAFYTDRFQGANCGFLSTLLEGVDTLLELRIFREDAELWVHRTSLDADFSWRIADDQALLEQSGEADLPAAMEKYAIKQRHLLDISPEYAPYMQGETDERGCRKLRSSIGGTYSLPLDDLSSQARKPYGYVRLVSYVSYDESGVAGVVDYRLTGFDPLEKGEDKNAAGYQSL